MSQSKKELKRIARAKKLEEKRKAKKEHEKQLQRLKQHQKWKKQVETTNPSVMCKEAWATTYQKPLKFSHREKRKRDKRKKDEKILKNIDGAQMTQHALNRANKRGITAKDIKITVKNGRVHQQSSDTFKIVNRDNTLVVAKRKGPMEKKNTSEKPRKKAIIDLITVYKNKFTKKNTKINPKP